MRKFFLEDYGLLTWQHLFFTSLAFAILALLLVLFWKRGQNLKRERFVRITFWVLVICEVAKILYNIFYRHGTINDYLPLYFCSLTIYACGLAGYGKGKIRDLGASFLFFGGIVAGLCYLAYPSSALTIHPLIHPLTIHSMWFHIVTVLLGFMMIKWGWAQLNIREIGPYLIFTYSFSLVAYIINISAGTNLMFLNDPWEIPILQRIANICGPCYPLVIATGQNVGTFFLAYGGGLLFHKLRSKREAVEC